MDPGDGAAEEPEEAEEGDVNPEEERKGSKIKKKIKKIRLSVEGDFGSSCSGRNPKRKERRKRRELRKPHCSKFQLHLFYIVVEDLLGLQTALLGQRKDE